MSPVAGSAAALGHKGSEKGSSGFLSTPVVAQVYVLNKGFGVVRNRNPLKLTRVKRAVERMKGDSKEPKDGHWVSPGGLELGWQSCRPSRRPGPWCGPALPSPLCLPALLCLLGGCFCAALSGTDFGLSCTTFDTPHDMTSPSLSSRMVRCPSASQC